MKIILFNFLFIITTSISYAQPIPKVERGSIVRVGNFSSKYIANRNIDIWLPEGYDKKNKYAVLYMQDGQMLYDSSITWNKKSWMIQEAISDLIDKQKIFNVIVVGIWNGEQKRHSEYFPQKPFEMLTTDQKTRIQDAVRKNNVPVFNNYEINSDHYLKFIVEELKPLIDEKFSTKKDAKNTFIGGSSMGGLISMYAICEYPQIFGGAICMSTHWPGIFEMENNPIPHAFIQYLEANLPNPKSHKIYFDCGDKTLDSLYPPLQNKVDEVMIKRGYNPKNWLTKYFTNQDHSEDAWRGRMQIPLQFMLTK
jgi:enterochelin esterase-like enzyme